MRPLHSIDYLSINDIDIILGVLINQIDFIAVEAITSEDELNYNQLKANIDYMKTGFERIESILNKKKRTRKPKES